MKGHRKERMLIQAVYGYNNPHSNENRQASQDMKEKLLKEKLLFKTEFPAASAIIAGDLNAAKDSWLDTNKPVHRHSKQREQEYNLLAAIEHSGVQDVFRAAHPNTRAWTREPTGDLESRHAARLIDHILATNELAHHLTTRIGIHSGFKLDSDHYPVIADFPINCAGVAENITPVWSPTVVYKLQMKEKVTPDDVELFNQRLKLAYEGADAPSNSRERYETMNNAIKEAAVGTIATRRKLTYPKFVTKYKGYTSKHFALRTWLARIRGAIATVKAAEKSRKTWQQAEEACKRAELAFKGKCGPMEDNLQGVAADLHTVPTEDTIARLVAQRDKADRFLKTSNANETSKQKRQAVKARHEQFNTPKGKGLKKFLNSVFKTPRKNHNLAWARRPDGTLADTPEELGQLVKQKFEAWFASVTPVEERWGSWGRMQQWDTSAMSDEKRHIAKGTSLSYRDFVEECYMQPRMWEDAEREGWWLKVLDRITSEEVQQAIADSKLHTAPGESQVMIDMIALMNQENVTELTTMFNTFLESGRIPDNMNSALLRLLPETDQGLSNLDKTRP